MLPAAVMHNSQSHIDNFRTPMTPAYQGLSDSGYYNHGYTGHHQYPTSGGGFYQNRHHNHHHHHPHTHMEPIMDGSVLADNSPSIGNGHSYYELQQPARPTSAYVISGGGNDACAVRNDGDLSAYMSHHHSLCGSSRSSLSSLSGIGLGLGSPVGMGMMHGGKQRKGKDDKICGVCGDRALSYNFDAISCESCKAFFRRNAPKGLDYFKCPYEESCRMDVSNRRFCKRCRLNKCFEIGMRKEYILTDEEKAMKRQKIEQNRLLRQTDSLSQLNLGDVTSQTVALRWDDQSAIDELVNAYKMSLETTSYEDDDWPRDRANMADLVNIAELSMRRLIAMTKQIEAFRTIPQEDQIQLLKSGSIELLILRSVITFDKEKQQFLDPFDHEETRALKLEQLEKAENGTGLFEDHVKFIRSLLVDLRADETTLILLLVISLFSPDRENLRNKQYVADQQEKYCQLLRKYLKSRFSGSVARAFFPRIVMKLTDVRSLNDEHSHFLVKMNPAGIQPLMKEVLDMVR